MIAGLRICVCWIAAFGFAIADEPPISVPDGFVVELFADDDLAHDIHSMTFNALGEVVVSGPGYIRVLKDTDGNGTADAVQDFADSPKSGAQGMNFIGRSLLCSGDNGLQLYSDKDGDGKADGPPKTFMKIKAGGEHHTHSIQKGPDGWWYVIAGNYAGVDSSFVKMDSSPIRQPEAGVLMRLKPNLAGGEIVAHGFRNAYDFAFHSSGDVFTFDSDGERDITLPWYRPCRVFQVTPRSHAGWVSRSWKRPHDFPDMMPTVAEFGRGSPTGVACYRHRQFPSAYDSAVFVLDWTFGRILVNHLTEDNGLWTSQSSVFAEGNGTFGFAPTDLAVAPDGSMFVSVGGRGTRGGVYRIRHSGKPLQRSRAKMTTVDDVLEAAQPLASWSRNDWVPAAKKIGQTAFRDVVTDEGRPTQQRIRAIEILVSEFGELPTDDAERLATARSAKVRARAAWALGRSGLTTTNVKPLLTFLQDPSPLVRRFALEALMNRPTATVLAQCLAPVSVALGQSNQAVFCAASQVVGILDARQKSQLLVLLANNIHAQVGVKLNDQVVGRIDRQALNIAAAALSDSEATRSQKLHAIRLLQKSLGDFGPNTGVPAMFESYQVTGDFSSINSQLNPIRKQLLNHLPSDNKSVNRELIRSISMLGSQNTTAIDRLLAGITADSSPTDDIHRLAALTAVSVNRSIEQSDATAKAIVDVDVKIHQRKLNQDSNWEARFNELLNGLCDADPQIAARLPSQTGFGLPAHVQLLKKIPAAKTQLGIDGFASQIVADKNYEWTTDVVFVLGRSLNAEHLKLVRQQKDNFSVQDAVTIVLSRRPKKIDRPLYRMALKSSQPAAVEAALKALLQLPKSNNAEEQFLLIKTAERLNQNAREYALRESAIRLLQNNLQQTFGFRFGAESHQPQPKALAGWRNYIAQRYPDHNVSHQDNAAAKLLKDMNNADWSQGNVDRGRQLFSRLACAKCHGGRKALGPDLQGVGKRFGKQDLLATIVEPDRDVSSRYQTTTVETTNGRALTGLIVYESVDGVMLRDAELKTHRIEADEIESQIKRRTSLMPSGLLNQSGRQDVMDLIAYLSQL